MPYPAAIAAVKADAVFSTAVLPSCKPRWAIGRATSHSSARMLQSAEFEHALDFDGGIARQGRHADGASGMTSFIAKYRHHQIRGAVHYLGTIEKSRIRVDESAESDHTHHPVEIARCGLDLRNQIDATGPRGVLSILDGHAGSKLPFG